MLELDQARPIIEKAIDLGVNFFDTSSTYSSGRSEEILGEVVKGRRDEVIVATKVYYPMGENPNQRGLSRLNIMHQIEGSLKRLGVNYVDLYQIHRWDYETPIEETLCALDDLVRGGKVMYVGASSMYAWQFSKALWTCDRLNLTRFVSMQNHYNLCYREEEREMIPLCQDQGIGVLPWSPLAMGFLSGKYTRDETPKSARYRSEPWLSQRYFRPEDFNVLEEVVQIAKSKGVTPSQIALAWLLHKGVVAPVLGATRLCHIEEAVESTNIRLEADDIRRLEAPYKPHPVIGHSYTSPY